MLLKRENEEEVVCNLLTAGITAFEEFSDSPGRISDSSCQSNHNAADPQHSTHDPFAIQQPKKWLLLRWTSWRHRGRFR